MARPLRIQFEGAVYHLTSRGNERKPIYRCDSDRKHFLEIFSRVIDRYGWVCHAYCLMDNHYHLLIETPRANLAIGMRQLNGCYTQDFNRRHKRSGHLFQGRFKAILVQKDAHALELSRYIVLNPVRAKMVKYPEDYQWSSYQSVIGKVAVPKFLSTNWILGQFSKQRFRAVEKYRIFVHQGRGQKVWDKLQGQIFFGSLEFVKKYQTGKEFIEEIPKDQQRPIKLSLEELLKNKNGFVSAYRDYGYSLKQIADHCGLHYTTISKRIRHYEKSKN